MEDTMDFISTVQDPSLEVRVAKKSSENQKAFSL